MELVQVVSMIVLVDILDDAQWQLEEVDAPMGYRDWAWANELTGDRAQAIAVEIEHRERVIVRDDKRVLVHRDASEDGNMTVARDESIRSDP